MNTSHIKTTVLTCLRDITGDPALELSEDAVLRDAVPGFDSLRAMEFITSVEDALDVAVDFVQHDVRFRMETLESSVSFLMELLEDKRALSV